jgi:hypothetical protein
MISVEVALGSAAPLAFAQPPAEVNWSKFNFFLGMFPCRPPSVIPAAPQRIASAVNDRIGIEPRT